MTDGTHTANLTLLGQYSTANFSLSNDDHGGTIITDRHHWSVLLQARHWLRMCKR